MKIIVTSYPTYSHLLDNFKMLYNKFWGEEHIVDIADIKEKKSDQLLRILNNMEDEYFILLEDDFYLLKEVDKVLVKDLFEYAKNNNIDRISLQCIKDGYEGKNTVYDRFKNKNIYKATDRFHCLFSLEASIWKKEFMLNLLKSGLQDREIENQMSDAIRNKKHMILVLDEPVLKYADAIYGGEQRIRFEDNKVLVLRQGGWETGAIL